MYKKLLFMYICTVVRFLNVATIGYQHASRPGGPIPLVRARRVASASLVLYTGCFPIYPTKSKEEDSPFGLSKYPTLVVLTGIMSSAMVSASRYRRQGHIVPI